MKIVGVNGIRSHGAGNIDRLLMEMRDRGLKTVDVKLPWRSILSARWGGEDDGRLVARASHDGDVIVAHSYGCLRAWYAHQARDYKAIICIAPAMDKDTKWRDPERVHCYHSPGDWVIKLGCLLLFWHPFGAAGNAGFVQEGVHNYRIKDAGHNDYFVGHRMQFIASHIAEIARAPELSSLETVR